MAAYLRVDGVKSSVGWLPSTPGSAPGPTLGNDYGEILLLYSLLVTIATSVECSENDYFLRPSPYLYWRSKISRRSIQQALSHNGDFPQKNGCYSNVPWATGRGSDLWPASIALATSRTSWKFGENRSSNQEEIFAEKNTRHSENQIGRCRFRQFFFHHRVLMTEISVLLARSANLLKGLC